MEQTTLHIVSHSHWDREWYLPFEKHRYRLVKLIDDILDEAGAPDFHSFHLDGQTVLLEDYLEIRPYMRGRIQELIAAGKLQIGPFYILQDEYLIDGESNVRNVLIGLSSARELGEPCTIGYFPDAFGNIGQMPQILRQFGMDTAVFGRGLNKVEADNKLSELQQGLNSSELKWQAPDGSEVVGIMFSNWYHNANHLPREGAPLKERVDEIVRQAKPFAQTPHLLGMNGSDHQPLQKGIGKIVRKAQQGRTEKVIHSSLSTYREAIRPYESGFPVVHGEIAGQYTDGIGLLVNTASAKIYLKQENHRCEKLVEMQTEPIAVLDCLLTGREYPSDYLRYIWKLLLKNHPHDSICGCGCDEVSREMMCRFAKVSQSADMLIQDSVQSICTSMSRDGLAGNEQVLTVFNPFPYPIRQRICCVVPLPSMDLGQTEAENMQFLIRTASGEEFPTDTEYLGQQFSYTLPDNAFRQVSYPHSYRVSTPALELLPCGYTSFSLVPLESEGVVKKAGDGDFTADANGAENPFLRLTIHQDGSWDVLHKETGRLYQNLGVFEDVGDIGEEYNFVGIEGDTPITTLGCTAEIKMRETVGRVEYEITQHMAVPASADKAVHAHEYGNPRARSGRRKQDTVEVTIVSTLTMEHTGRQIEVSACVENRAMDHRLRVLFPTGVATAYCSVDGQFDIVERPIQPWQGWENPSRCNKQGDFVELSDERGGLLVANAGLPEYEILPQDGTVALTLLRCVGEMGDWGYFPTPDAQCQGKYEFRYAVAPFGNTVESHETVRRLAKQFSLPGLAFRVSLAEELTGSLPRNFSLLRMDGQDLTFSCLKRAENDNEWIFRFHNVSAAERTMTMQTAAAIQQIRLSALDERVGEDREMEGHTLHMTIPPKKIVTLRIASEYGNTKMS